MILPIAESLFTALPCCLSLPFAAPLVLWYGRPSRQHCSTTMDLEGGLAAMMLSQPEIAIDPELRDFFDKSGITQAAQYMREQGGQLTSPLIEACGRPDCSLQVGEGIIYLSPTLYLFIGNPENPTPGVFRPRRSIGSFLNAFPICLQLCAGNSRGYKTGIATST